MPDFVEIAVPFATGANVRDLLAQPHLAQFGKEDITALVVGPKRLADVVPFLHKPASKPSPLSSLPSGSIFRGMIFGHIAVYTSKTVDETEGKVFARAGQAPASAPPAEPARQPQPGPAISERFKVQMVGMPTKSASEHKQKPDAGQPFQGADPLSAQGRSERAGGPSEDKVNRWTELIPSGTRIRKPKYQQEASTVFLGPGEIPLPGMSESGSKAPQAPPPAPAPAPLPAAVEIDLPVDKPPADLASADRVRLAKEADRIIFLIISALEGVAELTHEEVTDLVTEMRMLQLELDKYKPGIVRITEMIMAVSNVPETQESVARLKECLRGLGLLL